MTVSMTTADSITIMPAPKPSVKKERTQSFADLGLPEILQSTLARLNYTAPTPIQAATIPLAMAGHDILGTAQTGTGKTAAFGLPVLAALLAKPGANALILTPTRELAAQVLAAIQQMMPLPAMKSALLIGGEGMTKQFRQLSQQPRLVVGTPGRVNDHISRGSLHLKNTEFLVLDETDRMLDMGFSVQLDQIIKHMPSSRQNLLFSATLPAAILKLSTRYMKNPQRVAVGAANQAIPKIKQQIIPLAEGDKYAVLLDELNKRTGSIIIFVKTKHGADRLADKLHKAGHQSDAIHGDLAQRQRDRVILAFRNKQHRILVATDVAARGLDIPHIEHVINYDLPQCAEDYIHRIGRTARAGAEGEAVNFITSADGAKWRAIHKLMNPNEKMAPIAGLRLDEGKGAGPRRRGRGAGGGGGGGFGGNKSPRSGEKSGGYGAPAANGDGYGKKRFGAYRDKPKPAYRDTRAARAA